MGEKPQHVLTRFLIRKFFEKHRPASGMKQLEASYSSLKSCYEKYGFMSEKCTQEQNEVDFYYETAEKLDKEFNDMHLERYVINELNTPAYHKLQKGRYKDMYTGPKPRADSLYDGIIMNKGRR